MFAPPEPRTSAARILANAIVAPYAADASQRIMWEMGLDKHKHALDLVTTCTDQSEPPSFADESLQLGRERSRAFAADLACRQIGQENKRLIGTLAEIIEKPSNITRMIEQTGRRQVPPRGLEADRRRRREVQRENELLVKRLLAVRPSFNRTRDERDYQRHRRDVERIKKVQVWPARCALKQGQIRDGRCRQNATTLRLPCPNSSVLSVGTLPSAHASRRSAATSSVSNATLLPPPRPNRTLPPLPSGMLTSMSAPALPEPERTMAVSEFLDHAHEMKTKQESRGTDGAPGPIGLNAAFQPPKTEYTGDICEDICEELPDTTADQNPDATSPVSHAESENARFLLSVGSSIYPHTVATSGGDEPDVEDNLSEADSCELARNVIKRTTLSGLPPLK